MTTICKSCKHSLRSHVLTPDHEEMVATLQCIAFAPSKVGGFCPCGEEKWIVVEGVEL